MASHPRRLLALVQHYANSLKSKMRIWKYFCSSVYTGQSHWRGSIVAIFLPVQCYWEVTAIWHAHINLQLTSPSLGLSFHSTKVKSPSLLTSPSLSFPCSLHRGKMSKCNMFLIL
uniref:Uncharacterized protein n=1 Tax=Populus trichocarpa TaxID=3694 RepID=A0A3N7FPD5_POPTR